MEEQTTTTQKKLQKIIFYSIGLFILLFFFVTPCVYQNDNLYGKLLVTIFELSAIMCVYTIFSIFASLKIDYPIISTLFFIYLIACIYLFLGRYSASASFDNFPNLNSLKYDATARYNFFALLSFLTFIVLLLPCIFYKSLKIIVITYFTHIIFLLLFYISLSQLSNIYEFDYKKSYIDYYKGSFTITPYFYNVKKNVKEIINIFGPTKNS